MSKFKRLSLSESLHEFPLVNEETLEMLKGGCGECDYYTSLGFTPISESTYESLVARGVWEGGFVCGLGYVLPEATVNGNYMDGQLACFFHNTYFDFSEHCEQCYQELNPYDYNQTDGDSWEGGSSSGSSQLPHPPIINPPIAPPVIPPGPPFKDGVNVNNSDHFTFNMGDNKAFDGQLKGILATNSVLKGLLHYFDKGYFHMTFSVGPIEEGGQAQTLVVSKESFHITFDQKYIDENGWNKILEQDNVGYDWSKVNTKEEALVIALTHEALHAKHLAIYNVANDMGQYSIDQSVKYLSDKGYSEEFMEIFYHKDEYGYWQYNNTDNQSYRLEEYIRNNNHSVLNAALEEYRKDH